MVKTKFLKLAEVFDRLERTSSNLAMIDILAEFFPKISPEEAKISAYLLRGELSPSYEGLEMGLAGKTAIKAISRSENVSLEKVASLFKKTGDFGSIVEIFKKNKKGEELTIEEVFEKLLEIAKIGGKGSQEKKLNLLADLLSKVSGVEAKYIIRTVLGILRLGVGEMIFLYGLAKAFGNLPVGQAIKKQKEALEYAFNVLSDFGEIARLVSKFGIKKVSEIEPKVGAPIRVMLSSRIEELKEIKDHIVGLVSIEDKYDGERIQAHIKENGEVFLFSRQQENITHQYPDIIDGLKKSFSGKEAIIEGEVAAYDEKKEKILPFQILMSRRRKHKVEEYIKKIPIRYFLFDLIYLDGNNYMNRPLKERRMALEHFFKKIKPIGFGRYAITDDLSEIESYFVDSIKRGNEGIMIKDYFGIYQAGSRGWLWIKFKKEYKEELADTFDLTIIGALYGAGKRANTYGSLLLAAYDPEENKYYSFTKVGSGFTDEILEQLPKMLDKYKLIEKHKFVETGMKTDVWFEPKIVMEVMGAEITVSPTHTVAKNKIKKGGLALRFPIFIRWREDKSPENATTVKEIYDLYKSS